MTTPPPEVDLPPWVIKLRQQLIDASARVSQWLRDSARDTRYRWNHPHQPTAPEGGQDELTPATDTSDDDNSNALIGLRLQQRLLRLDMRLAKLLKRLEHTQSESANDALASQIAALSQRIEQGLGGEQPLAPALTRIDQRLAALEARPAAATTAASGVPTTQAPAQPPTAPIATPVTPAQAEQLRQLLDQHQLWGQQRWPELWQDQPTLSELSQRLLQHYLPDAAPTQIAWQALHQWLQQQSAQALGLLLADSGDKFDPQQQQPEYRKIEKGGMGRVIRLLMAGLEQHGEPIIKPRVEVSL